MLAIAAAKEHLFTLKTQGEAKMDAGDHVEALRLFLDAAAVCPDPSRMDSIGAAQLDPLYHNSVADRRCVYRSSIRHARTHSVGKSQSCMLSQGRR